VSLLLSKKILKIQIPTTKSVVVTQTRFVSLSDLFAPHSHPGISKFGRSLFASAFQPSQPSNPSFLAAVSGTINLNDITIAFSFFHFEILFVDFLI